MTFGSTTDLSEQYLLDCNTKGYSCSGGWWGFDDMMNGTPKRSCYPYTAHKAPCKTTCPKFYPISKWYYVGSSNDGVPSVDDIKNAIYNYGPVAAGVYVDIFFQNYTGGIFNHCTPDKKVNHAVVLIGWNDEGSYWILKNSWGKGFLGWGEDGYMRIRYDCSKVGFGAAYAIPLKADGYKIPGQSTSAGPAAALFNNKLYCIYKANDSSNAIWVTYTSDGEKWTGYKIPGQNTSAGPAATVFNNKLYCIYKANDSSNAIWVTSTSDGAKWTGYKIPGQNTSAGPAATVFNNKLYCIYKANDSSNAIWVTSTSDGVKWTGYKIPGQSTSAGPAAALFNNKLYCIYKANDSTNAIWVTSTSDGEKWTGYKIPGQSTSAGPALTVFNNKLYCVYKASDLSTNDIWVTSTNDGANWISTYNIPMQNTSAEPAAAVFNNKPYCIYKANDSSNAIWITTIILR